MTVMEAKAWALRIVAMNARAEREIIDGEFESAEDQKLAVAALGEIAGELLIKAGIRACRSCGCTEDDACVDGETTCSWAEQDLCSACERKEVSR